MTLMGFDDDETCPSCDRPLGTCPCGSSLKCRKWDPTTGDLCGRPVVTRSMCRFCNELDQLCREHDETLSAEPCVCGHAMAQHGGVTGSSECLANDASCACSRFVLGRTLGPVDDGRVFTREMLEKAREPNPSPVIAVVAVHENGGYTIVDEKPSKRIVLYVDERNEFGKKALEWFQSRKISYVRIPMSGGLPFATQGVASYAYDELEQFAKSLVLPRVFKRSAENPDSGLPYETCSTCGKHVRHHYGASEYRCDPAY